MNFQTIATLKLMEKGKIIYTINFENLLDYDFIWDSSKLTKLHLITSNLNINDLNMLIAKPYDSYVLIGVKKISENGQEKVFDIPPRVFKHLIIKGNYKNTDLTFYETWNEDVDKKWVI